MIYKNRKDVVKWRPPEIRPFEKDELLVPRKKVNLVEHVKKFQGGGIVPSKGKNDDAFFENLREQFDKRDPMLEKMFKELSEKHRREGMPLLITGNPSTDDWFKKFNNPKMDNDGKFIGIKTKVNHVKEPKFKTAYYYFFAATIGRRFVNFEAAFDEKITNLKQVQSISNEILGAFKGASEDFKTVKNVIVHSFQLLREEQIEI